MAAIFRCCGIRSSGTRSFYAHEPQAGLAGHGIDVYEVRPGVIRFDMTAGVTEKYDELFEQGLALNRRWGTPEDVGTAVATLARGDIPYATGSVVTVDGGLTVPRL